MSERKPDVEVQPTVAAESLSAESLAAMSVTPSTAQRDTVIAGRYEVLGLLGEGGMGTVYRARDAELDEIVAVKMLRHELVNSPGMLERFRREVKLARRVTHKNVARAFDIGEHEGEKFLTMEYVDGESLARLVARERRLSRVRVVEIARAVCEGLVAAHEAGVVHRDLKPDNVLIAKDGRVVITDFGIARAFEAGDSSKTQGLALGTPAYMAPEQVEGSHSIDARADIYALGVMLFELLTGQQAWKGDSPYAVAAARLVLPPPDPSAVSSHVGPEARDLVMKCMARAPADRFASVREVEQALAAVPIEETGATAVGGAISVPSAKLTKTTHTTASGDKTVAVLPLRNGGAPEDDYLAASLTEDLIDMLSMTAGLRVRPRGLVAHLAKGEHDVRAIGQELGVQVVVEGSMRRAGEQLRVSTRVLSVADGFQLWAKRFDRPASDLFAVSDEVARAVADALTVSHVQKERAAPTDPVALDLFLRARHEYHRFEPASVAKSIELFDEAIALAPSNVQILAGGAMARVRLWFFGGEGSAEQARELAEKAISIAPNRAEALTALAAVRFQDGFVEETVTLARRALVIAPAAADAHELLGRVLAETGPPAMAVQALTTATRLDPGFEQAVWSIARVRALLGSWDEAIRMLRESIAASATGAGWTQLARLVYWHGDRAMAESLLATNEAEIAKRAPLAWAILRHFLHPSESFDPLASFPLAVNPGRASWRGRSFLGQARAEFAMALGQRDVAFAAIADAVDAGLIDHLWFELCPAIAGIRDEPRLAPYREKVRERAEAVKRALA